MNHKNKPQTKAWRYRAMTQRKNELRTAYEMAIKHFGLEKANEILGIILDTEIRHQNITEQMAEAFKAEFTAA